MLLLLGSRPYPYLLNQNNIEGIKLIKIHLLVNIIARGKEQIYEFVPMLVIRVVDLVLLIIDLIYILVDPMSIIF